MRSNQISFLRRASFTVALAAKLIVWQCPPSVFQLSLSLGNQCSNSRPGASLHNASSKSLLRQRICYIICIIRLENGHRLLALGASMSMSLKSILSNPSHA